MVLGTIEVTGFEEYFIKTVLQWCRRKWSQSFQIALTLIHMWLSEEVSKVIAIVTNLMERFPEGYPINKQTKNKTKQKARWQHLFRCDTGIFVHK